MSSNASSIPAAVSDEQLIADLSSVLAAVEAELAEIEPRGEQLSARAEHLRATIAVYKGDTPAKPRRAYKRRPKPAATSA
jgi:hypothetical protein